MLHPYARVGYALSPHPTVQAHAKKHLSAEDRSAINNLICKLLIPRHIVGQELINRKAKLINIFWEEYGEKRPVSI